MKRNVAALAVVALAILAASDAEAGVAGSILGVWRTADNDSAAEYYACGAAVCARLVWLRSPIGPDGRPRLDAHNPDPAKRGQPLCGLQIVRGLTPRGPTRATGGKVYAAADGRTYDLDAQLVSPTRLKLRGYLGTPMLGQDILLDRVEGLPRCQTPGASVSAAAAAPATGERR